MSDDNGGDNNGGDNNGGEKTNQRKRQSVLVKLQRRVSRVRGRKGNILKQKLWKISQRKL